MSRKFFQLFFDFKFLLLNSFSLFFLNNQCICCGKNSGILNLCKTCAYKEFNFDFNIPRCQKCGKKLLSEDNLCFECRENSIIENIDSVIPLFSYKLWKKEVLFNWKLSGQRNYALFFAKKIFPVYEKFYKNLPIVPVPPRPHKIWKNGWDQINDLSFVLNKYYGIEILHLLKRTEVQQQKKLNRNERISHKGSIYVYDPKLYGKQLPEEVVIIDDILTTGVTLESCAEILKKNGVKKVHAITVFIAD